MKNTYGWSNRIYSFFEKNCVSEKTEIIDRNTYFVLRSSLGSFFIGILFTNSILTTLLLFVFTPVFLKNKIKIKINVNLVVRKSGAT